VARSRILRSLPNDGGNEPPRLSGIPVLVHASIYDYRVPRTLNDPLDPTGLETATFPLVRRGFDPVAVRTRFKAVAAAARELQSEVEELKLRGPSPESDEVDGDRLEAHRIAEAIGAEATRVLESAHEAARDRAERAEREATAVRDEAISAADAARTSATTEAGEIVARAKRDAETIVEDGRSHGRHMVAEAQIVRERMLGDLSRKRQSGRAQVEKLRAARDRLLESLSVVQQSLDTAVGDLVESVPEARAAAERAGLRIEQEPVPSAQVMDAEIEAARLVGHPLVEGVEDPGPEPEFVTGESEQPSHPESPEQVVDGRPEFFDLEAENQSDPEVETEGPEPVPEPVEEAEPEPESVEEADGVDDLFAKLRSTKSDPVPAEPIPEMDAEPDAGPPESDSGSDEVLATRQAAASRAGRALKKIVVDEQGALLDGIRRTGVDALRELVDDREGHFAIYDNVALPELQIYAVDIGCEGEINLSAALEQLHSIAVEPIRHRLAEFVRRFDEGDEPDEGEMTDAVRAMYRESRSRRIPEAVSAAVVAVDGLVVIAGKPAKVSWQVDPDGPCGPDCADNALAGAMEPGEQFPTGDTHPPVHVACTCRLVPVTP